MARKRGSKTQPSKKDSKVIRVAFGPGGGRIEDETPEPAAVDLTPLPEPSGKEPVADLYTQTEVTRLLGITRGRLRSLDRAGIVSPTGRRRGKRAYTFSDIIALRAARDLLAERVSMREVAKAVDSLRSSLPRVTRPLSELRITSDGKRVVVKTRQGNFQPVTGQCVMDFEVRQLQDDVVRVLRPRAGRERSRKAYELYVRASQLDEHPDTMDEAEALYRQAIKHDPWLAIVYTNLGNIRFRKGDETQAESLYRAALEIEGSQPEAQYNLGYMLLQRGQPAESVEFFEGAIASDAAFADAYFNLAMAYEQVSRPSRARMCWRRYLEIEPSGTWAEIARKHLGD